MPDKTMSKPQVILLIVIITVGAFLRFYHFSDWSLSNDELSALNRVRFDSFSELIDKGVRVEGHPAGYQTFVYVWTKIAGDSKVAFRIPFILAGIFSLGLLFLIAKRWFGTSSALTATAAFSTLQFPILYSQLARPYSLGLLFSLVMVYCWTFYVFNNKKSWIALVGFIIFGSLCTYLHYFSFMLAGIVGISGIFLIQKKYLKTYVLAGILILLLFIPHVGVFIDQLAQGGIGEWLDPPSASFFFEHVFYWFNESYLVLIAFLGSFIFSFFFLHSRSPFTTFHIIALVFFFVPFLMGFTYSVAVAPVVQHSTLLFSGVYLILFLFSFIPPLSSKQITLVVSSILIIGGVSTIWEKQFYTTQHFGEFEALANSAIKWQEKYGSENVTAIYNINNPYYFQYYFDKAGMEYQPAKTSLDHGQDIAKLKQLLETCNTPYFVYSWSSRYNPFEVEDLIREKYPKVIERNVFFNSDITLYKKEGEYIKNVLFQTHPNYSESNNGWNTKNAAIDSSLYISPPYSERLDENHIYSSTFNMEVKDICKKTDSVLIKARVFARHTNGATGQLVLSIERNGESLEWHSAHLEHFWSENEWSEALITKPFPNNIRATDKIKCYVWNTGKEPILIDNLFLEVYRPDIFNYP